LVYKQLNHLCYQLLCDHLVLFTLTEITMGYHRSYLNLLCCPTNSQRLIPLSPTTTNSTTTTQSVAAKATWLRSKPPVNAIKLQH
jgi:hypothetical protein